jgi:two-component system cell cycle response regulator
MTARILVVDDAELNTMLLEAKLSSEYYEVIAADNGPAALELAESELPDIILLDVMMPRMDGFEVCRRLKANPRTTDIPVVMVTALSDVADRLRGLESGADEFLTKPVNDTELFARVRSLVRLKRMMEELRFREQVCRRFGNAEYAAEMAEDVRGARILLLEADQTTMLQIPNAVAPLTAAVLRATSCAAAQTLIDPSIEVVIASLSMPDGDPLRLVSQWRASEATRQLPIVLLGEKRELPRLAKGLELGANDYLVRPIDRNELLARVRTQIRRKRLQDRLGENYRRSLAQALTDELTGVYNRRYVFAHLNELIARMSESGTTTAVLPRPRGINGTRPHSIPRECRRALLWCRIARRTARHQKTAPLARRRHARVRRPAADLAWHRRRRGPVAPSDGSFGRDYARGSGLARIIHRAG